jgi:2-polyprenyl-3-methyl-5-hydroxy-6-metoxy-1,4-benzoquinol methylase
MADAHDGETLAWYDREAPVYASRRAAGLSPHLEIFLGRLAPGAAILELGCGGGQDAEVMIAAGFDVTPTDGSPGLVAEAERRLSRPVRLMRFEDLDETERYDAVWANACLLHVPEPALPHILGRTWRALKPGGLCFASFKAGDGGDRDGFGRYYNFPSQKRLQAAYAAAGVWSELTMTEAPGGGYDGVPRSWILCLAVKG